MEYAASSISMLEGDTEWLLVPQLKKRGGVVVNMWIDMSDNQCLLFVEERYLFYYFANRGYVCEVAV